MIRSLITPKQVIELAFSAGNALSPTSIKESKIIAAQEKYLRPVLGKLYDALLEGNYPELLEDYLRPALAHYVRYAIIPDISLRLNDKGVQMPFSDHANAASDKQRAELRQQDREDADVLLDMAVRYISEHRDRYSEYTPQKNGRSRTLINGGVILT